MASFLASSTRLLWGVMAISVLYSSPVLAGAGHSHSHSHGTNNTAAHVHGVAEMEIVQDGNGLFIKLYSPLDNVLGFEHAPRTDAEKVKARRVTALLKANGLFAFTPDAQCKASGQRLYSEILNPHRHGPEDDHQHHEKSGGHSDMQATYEFECARPEKLRQIDVRLFRQFPGFEKIEVQALFPKGQVGATLTPGKTVLNAPE